TLRQSQDRSGRRTIVGPGPRRRRSQSGPPLSIALAFTTTPCCCRSRESWSVSAKDGISVTKWTDSVDAPAGLVAFAKSPCSLLAVEVTETTLSARTCWMKKGLYGT